MSSAKYQQTTNASMKAIAALRTRSRSSREVLAERHAAVVEIGVVVRLVVVLDDLHARRAGSCAGS